MRYSRAKVPKSDLHVVSSACYPRGMMDKHTQRLGKFLALVRSLTAAGILSLGLLIGHPATGQEASELQHPAPAYLYQQIGDARPEIVANDAVGYETCANCHQSEFKVWSQTWHHTSFRTLHRQQGAREIARRLGQDSVKYSDRCIKCHYSSVGKAGDKALTINAAVSCECCHGAGKNWYGNHFPVQVNDSGEAPESRAARISNNISNGMRNRHNTYTMARICMRCHNVADEELVNVGKHSLGDLDFEMVAWSQGKMRHRFVSGGGLVNQTNSQERLAAMYVCGAIADLEFSLRATAAATTKANFGIEAAKRTHWAAKRLTALQTELKSPLIEEILAVYAGVTLTTNNQVALLAAADKVQAVGIRFGAEAQEPMLRRIYDRVPSESEWRWE